MFRRRRLFRTRPRRRFSVYRRRRFLRFKSAPKKRGWFRGVRRVSRFGQRRMRLMRQIGVERMYNSANGLVDWTSIGLIASSGCRTYTSFLNFPRLANSLQNVVGKRIVSTYQNVRLTCPQEMTIAETEWAYLRIVILRQKRVDTTTDVNPNPRTDPNCPMYAVDTVTEHYATGGNGNWKVEYDRVFNFNTFKAMPIINLNFGKLREIGFTPVEDTLNLLNVVKNRYWMQVIVQTKTTAEPTYLPTVGWQYRMQFANIGGEKIV